MLVQIKGSSRKKVEAREAAKFKLEGQGTIHQKKIIRKERKVEENKEPLSAVSFRQSFLGYLREGKDFENLSI